MASVDQTILALFETPKTPSGGSGGPGPGDCILAEGVTQLHRLAESAEHAAERCAGQRSEAAEAAEQQQFAHEVQLQELETQNLRLKAELAKSQSLPDWGKSWGWGQGFRGTTEQRSAKALWSVMLVEGHQLAFGFGDICEMEQAETL